jgi:hypothetical protein
MGSIMSAARAAGTAVTANVQTAIESVLSLNILRPLADAARARRGTTAV